MVSLADIQRFFRGTLLLSEPVAPYTTLGIGGPADYFLEAYSKEELEELLNYFRENNFPHCILGPNLLVSNEGFRGAVILDKTKQETFSTARRGAQMFKSDIGSHAENLIRQTGVNGLLLGGAEVVGNTVVNSNDASARDIYDLVHHVQHIIFEQWNVLLPIELQFVGFEQASMVNVA